MFTNQMNLFINIKSMYSVLQYPSKTIHSTFQMLVINISVQHKCNTE